MTSERMAAIRIPLTDEQRRQIREATGADVREAVFAAPVSAEGELENELVTEAGQEVAGIVWQNHHDFLRNLDKQLPVRRAFEERIGHELDPKSPTMVFLR